MLLYGKEIREQIKERIRQKSEVMNMSMAVLQVGEDRSSQAYVNSMIKFAGENGIAVESIRLAATAAEDEVLKTIADLNQNSDITGIMIQTPLPGHLQASRLINAIDYRKDVEGLHNYNLGKLISREKGVTPVTPKAVISMLKGHNIPIAGKKVTIIGRSMIVGSPLAVMLTAEDATVTVCHSRTANLKQETLAADILIVAMGKAHFITPDMVREESIIVDVGTNVDESGRMLGDVHPDANAKARLATAVPGGVGAVTVAELFDNLCVLKEQLA